MRVWSWGANNTGQLGHGFVSEQVSSPTLVNHFLEHFQYRPFLKKTEYELIPLIKITAGGSHAIICDASEDQLYHFHHLGLIGTKWKCPQEQTLPKANGEINEVLVSGWDFALFLNTDGQLYSMGDNTYCQLGRSTTSELCTSNNFSSTNFSPCWRNAQLPTKLGDVSAGMRHVVGITTESSLICWGDNSKGQTGVDLDLKLISEPTIIIPHFKPAIVRCSKMATIVLSEDGCFYGSGLNKFGMLGENFQNVLPGFIKLFQIEDPLTDIRVKDYQCGWNHVLVLLENGKLMSWGRNNFSQLGRPCQQISATATAKYDGKPGFVEGLPEKIVAISCGSEHNLVLGVSGQVYSWGWNEHENCGTSGSDSSEVVNHPTKVELPTTESAGLIGCGGGNSFVFTHQRR